MIKRALLYLFLIGNTVFANSQIVSEEAIPLNKVPKAVQTQFNTVYENLEDAVTWYSVGTTMYKAKFKYNGENILVTYSFDGTVKNTLKEINKEGLPASLITNLNNIYPECEIKSVGVLYKANIDTFYRLELYDTINCRNLITEIEY